MIRDVRFGARLLARSPVFTITAVLLLATGIAANTLIFSAVDALLLRPLPVRHPENLVRLVEVHPHDFITWDLPYNLCAGLAARDASVSEAICQGETDSGFSYNGTTERVRVHLVSPNFFSSLGVDALTGRVLTAQDERETALNAVLSYGFWKRRFDGDTSVVGRKVTIGGYAFTIVGVTPPWFNGLAADTSPDVRVPAATDRYLVHRDADMLPTARPLFGQAFARLRPEVTFDRASEEADSLLQASYDEERNAIFPRTNASPAKSVTRSRLRFERVTYGVSALRGQFSRGLELLMAGVALLLLMACANVAGLLLARGAVREREFGVRLAVGASPARIVRQLLTEGLLLAILGGIAGLLLTTACAPLLVRALPPIRDRAAVPQALTVHIGIDFRVLAFAAAVTLLTVLAFALPPAWRATRSDLTSALRRGGAATRRGLPGKLIVTAQVAVCTLILVAAWLLVDTLARMRSMNPGFDSDHVVSFTIDPGIRGYKAEQSRALSKALLAKTRALPGVTAAAIAGRGVMRGTGIKATFGAAGTRMYPSAFLNSSLNTVTPGYFETMGMRMLAGRDFSWFDRSRSTPRPVVVNQTFARRFFPGRNPLSQVIGGPGPDGLAKPDDVIAGIVSDAKYRSLREPVPPTVYGPSVDGFDSDFILYVRTQARPESLIAPVRDVLRELDPTLPIIETHTLREEVDDSLWQERLLAWLAAVFAGAAALLAGAGLYGGLDYAIRRRTREIGVRMALGAGASRITVLLSGEALLPVAAGAALGLCTWAFVDTAIRRVLYGVTTWDPLAIAGVLLFMSTIAALAAGPAVYRAIRIDPATALRGE